MDFIESQSGDFPLIITVPHGGDLMPHSIPDRKRGVFVTDYKTIELSREIEKRCIEHGVRPYFIRLLLDRTKMDANRGPDKAYSSPEGQKVWEHYYILLRTFIQETVAKHGRCLLLDLHGQNHRDCIELGYGLDSDKLKDLRGLVDVSRHCTVRELAKMKFGNIERGEGGENGEAMARNGKKFTVEQLNEMIWGEHSFGAYLQKENIHSTPSPKDPIPDGNCFFSGGYTVCCMTVGKPTPLFSAIQVEVPIKYRKRSKDRESFAQDFVQAILGFMRYFGEK